MSFTPVSLVAPNGDSYVARDAVDLNDRVAEGYTRADPRAAASPARTPVASPSPVIRAQSDDTAS